MRDINGHFCIGADERRQLSDVCIQMYITYPALARTRPKPVGRAPMPFTDSILFLHSEENHCSLGQWEWWQWWDTGARGIQGQLTSYIKDTHGPVAPMTTSATTLAAQVLAGGDVRVGSSLPRYKLDIFWVACSLTQDAFHFFRYIVLFMMFSGTLCGTVSL